MAHKPRAFGHALVRGLAWFAPFLVAFAVYVSAFYWMDPNASGDEPHYLLVAESIAYDGDVELANDYASRDRTLRVVGFFPLGSYLHAGDYTDSGQLRPTHGVGLSALLAPAVAAGGVTGARFLMLLIAALLAYQLYRLLDDLGFRRRYRILGWAAAVFCLPVVAFSSQIYPEFPGALLIVIALRIMVRGARSPALLALGSTAGAALVWLHVRYFPLAAGVFFGLAFAASFQARADLEAAKKRGRLGKLWAQATTGIRQVAATLRTRWRSVTLPLVVPYMVSLGLLAVAFQHWYGSPAPNAPYSFFYENSFGSGGWDFLYEYGLSDLLQPTHGWIPYVPVHWVGLAALGCLLIRFGWAAAGGLAAAGGYALALASAALPIGWGMPARYLIIVIPFIAIPIALAIQGVFAARIIFVPLFAASLVFAAAAMKDPLWLYPISEKPRIFGIHSAASVFPSTRDLGFPTKFVVAPGEYGPQTGTVRNGRVIASNPQDGPGYLIYGPNSVLKGGSYRAIFTLSATQARPSEQVVSIDVIGGPPDRTFAGRTLTAGELRNARSTPITLPFTTPGGYFTQTRVFFHGRGTVTAGPVRVEPDQTTSFVLSPGGEIRPPTGTVRNGRVIASSGRDEPGFVLYGPYSGLKSGRYRATFSLAATQADPSEEVATLDVVGHQPTRVFAQRVVTAGELRRRGTPVTLTFSTRGGPTETRVYYHGRGTLSAGSVRVKLERATGSARARDWPLALLWVAGTVVVGWLFVRTLRRERHVQPEV